MMDPHEIQLIFGMCFKLVDPDKLEEYRDFLGQTEAIGPMLHPGLFGGIGADPDAFERLRVQKEMCQHLLAFHQSAMKLDALGPAKGKQ